jgi:phage shock protein A
VSDTIASRVTRVISGSVHAILDAVESAAPEIAMTQAVREVDQAIDEVRAELGRVEGIKHLAGSSLNKLNAQCETLAEQIDVAFAKGDEALARAGIAKQVDIEDQIPVLQRSLQEAIERGRELEGYIAALLAKKREMESALGDYLASRASTASATAEASGNGSAQHRVDRAAAAFDRVMARQTGISGLVSPISQEASKLRDLQELARNHRIDERFAALQAARPSRNSV